ncbi:hypothetical protein [Dactylosporangium fulvum]|uniref:WD40 repeat domain-containing protein n=1 Tax=Dactylosporangium fulvum TaxID=53359 RepID=A0ABY5W2D2_9ACTN|nr:hypothetical protein [Dactylosporangium fulvum]UWP83565.1 hypothetical protein Dfulv_04595 [Dactylosporangium fulvum]
MLEDALRDTFAAKAGNAPPGSLDGVADAAIRGAAQIRNRRRAMAGGLAGILAFAVAAITALQVVIPGKPAEQGHTADIAGPPEIAAESTQTGRQTPPPQAPTAVDAIGGTAQPTKKVRLQLPDKGTVAAAYQAKDGYLVVNTQPGGDKQQLVLQNDNNQQQVLVDGANNITVDKDGGQVAWVDQGKVTVGSRAGDAKKVTQKFTTNVPSDAMPVAFVGSDLVLGRTDGSAFDVWYPSRKYTESWDESVLRVFGAHPDGKSLYAEVKPVNQEKSMCLAWLQLDQPFKVLNKVCGLPLAERNGSRVSPDGHWLAYPVNGRKQVAIVDLTTVFTDGKSRLLNLNVTTKTVWLNATTFVVDNGDTFQALSPDGKMETLGVDSNGVVLIEPLYAG